MTVKYIMGRACKGKSHFILNEISENLCNTGDEKLFLLVPEQFTLQAERDLIEKLALPGIMQIEVLSFTRLAERVFEEAGGLTRILLNTQGKGMILKKIIEENAHQLTIYQKASKQEGFVARFSDLLVELKQNDIMPEQLHNNIAQTEEQTIIRQKLQDIILIYEKFNDYLKGRYIDTEDYINLFINKIRQANFLKNSIVWIDGFTTFSSQSLKIIEEIMLRAKDTTISLTIDFSGDEPDRELFTLSRRSYNRLHEAAISNGLKEQFIKIDPEPGDAFKKPEILNIESELYSYPYTVYEQDITNIEVFAAGNIYMEAENVAAQIISLARERGYRWKDIAVICNDMNVYGGLIKRVFHEYRIPFFIDEKKDIMNNPIIILILSLLDIIQRGYRYEDVFHCIKTGFCDLKTDECEKLENYVLKYGICGNRWKQEFEIGDEDFLDQVNQWRLTFINPLIKLEDKLRGKKNYAQITTALFEVLEEMRIPDKIEDKVEKLTEYNYYALASENSRIWNIVMEIFDQMVEIMGDQEVTLKEYKKVLEAGFGSYEIGIIPTTIDEVLIGNIQRSKSQDIKALFVIGVNDGVLPANREEEGILTGEEKDFLEEKGLEIGLNREMRSLEESFLIYSALSKPSDYLWLSFALADEEGRALRPSLIIERFKQIFSKLEIKSDLISDRQVQLEMISTPESTFKYLIQNLRQWLDGKQMEDFWWDVYGWYYGNSKWQESRSLMINGFSHQNQVAGIGQERARCLYNLPLRSSISRLEQFVSCPFAHFIRYGLSPREREMYTVDAPDIGDIFHNSLSAFASKLEENNLNWFELEREKCELIMDEVMDEQVLNHGHGVLASNYRYKYLAERLKRISRRAVWTLTEHLKSGRFIPLGYEIRFGDGGVFPAIEIDLENGEKLYLEGRIDRVDILDDNNASYVKVIDYKSGEKKFSLSDVYYGISLQLLIYLKAVIAGKAEHEKHEVKPAGILYFKIDDPLVDTEEKVIENIEKQISKELKMKGLVLKDVNIVREMDCNIQGHSSIIPAGINKDNGFYHNSSVMEEEDFIALISHVENLVKQIGNEIVQGRIKIEPLKTDKNEKCNYCKFKSVCQFDQMFEDNNFRNVRDLKDNEVIARIRKENNREGNEV